MENKANRDPMTFSAQHRIKASMFSLYMYVKLRRGYIIPLTNFDLSQGTKVDINL